MYHIVADEPYNENVYLFVTVSEFENQLSEISRFGFATVFADDLEFSSHNCIAINFDDGYEEVYINVFPILKKYNMKATVFLVCSTVGTDHHLNTEQIREMAESGLVRFGSHSVSHRDLTLLNINEVKTELSESKQMIEELTGMKIDCFSYPYGKYNEYIVKEIEKSGYVFGFTTEEPVQGSTYSKETIPRIAVFRRMGNDIFDKIK